MPIRPLYDRVVVRTLDPEGSTTASGIVISGGREVADRGIVVAVGVGYPNADNDTIRPLLVEVGDTVLFDPRSGAEFKIDGEDLRVFLESDLIGVL
jgi:chaperonin GroES